MDLDFSEEQQLLRETVRGVCARYCPLDSVRELENGPVGFATEFWKQLGELGLLGIGIPESYGGSGQSALEAAVLYEELGRALAPSPHFASAVLAAGALTLAGSEAQKRRFLPEIASGAEIWTPAWLEPQRGFGPEGVALAARADGDAVRLTGTKRHVPFASAATRLLVLARTGEGADAVDLFAVDPRAPGVRATQQLSIAGDTQHEVVFEDVRVPIDDRIGAAGSGWETWEHVMQRAIVLVAAQAVGGAERALEMTVEYAKERKQFEKPLGAFQAIAHDLADAATQVDGARTLVYEAAWNDAQGRSTAELAPMAKRFACRTFRDVTAMAQQVWGGVGFTIEYDIQLYFRRAKQLQLSWWDERFLEERIATAVLDASDG